MRGLRTGLAPALAVAIAPAVAGAAHVPGCRSGRCDLRIKAGFLRHVKQRTIHPYRAWLKRVRSCESHGDYTTNTGNGFYGAYQFSADTWHRAGGHGLPSRASRLEQDYRAVVWRKRIGNPHTTAGWPVCG